MLFVLAALAAAPAGASAACAGADVQLGRSFANDAPGSTDVAAAEHATLCLLNEYRVSRGAAPLILDLRLGRAARAHAEDMVARGYFAHDTPEGLGPGERAAKQGFPSGVGENIAYSSDVTPQSMFEQWRTSPGHDRNMLDRSYNVVGIGFALGMPRADGGPGSRGATGVQDFGRVAVPTGSDTGLDGAAPTALPTPAAGGSAPTCRAAAPSVAARAALLQARRRQLAATQARARAEHARVRAAHGHRARARAQRLLKADRRSVARALDALHTGQQALVAARTRATRACARP
jgi:uncharacterized protein YkwD